MGWSPGDHEKVERAKVELAQSREAAYKIFKLKQTISNIQHAEKRNAMLNEIEKLEHVADECFKNIESHLNR